MGRECVFRGKRLDNNEWVSGFFIPDVLRGGSRAYIAPNIMLSYSLNFTGKAEMSFYEIDPNTLGQYTGFSDLENNKIFEGDMVQFTNDNLIGTIHKREGTVIYDVSLSRFVVRIDNIDSTLSSIDLVESLCSELKIIGNSYDEKDKSI